MITFHNQQRPKLDYFQILSDLYDTLYLNALLYVYTLIKNVQTFQTIYFLGFTLITIVSLLNIGQKNRTNLNSKIHFLNTLSITMYPKLFQNPISKQTPIYPNQSIQRRHLEIYALHQIIQTMLRNKESKSYPSIGEKNTH